MVCWREGDSGHWGRDSPEAALSGGGAGHSDAHWDSSPQLGWGGPHRNIAQAAHFPPGLFQEDGAHPARPAEGLSGRIQREPRKEQPWL